MQIAAFALTGIADRAFSRSLLAGVLMAAPVGAVGIMCIGRALADGLPRALMVGLGSAVADAIFGTVAGLIIGVVSSFIVVFESELTLAGGIVVGLSGVLIYRAPVDSDVTLVQTGVAIRDAGRAFVLSIVNPATLIGALGIFAVFGRIVNGAEPSTAATLILGAFVGSMAWWILLATVVRAMRERFVLGALPRLNRIKGFLIAAFGLAAMIWAGWKLTWIRRRKSGQPGTLR